MYYAPLITVGAVLVPIGWYGDRSSKAKSRPETNRSNGQLRVIVTEVLNDEYIAVKYENSRKTTGVMRISTACMNYHVQGSVPYEETANGPPLPTVEATVESRLRTLVMGLLEIIEEMEAK